MNLFKNSARLNFSIMSGKAKMSAPNSKMFSKRSFPLFSCKSFIKNYRLLQDLLRCFRIQIFDATDFEIANLFQMFAFAQQNIWQPRKFITVRKAERDVIAVPIQITKVFVKFVERNFPFDRAHGKRRQNFVQKMMGGKQKPANFR